MTFPGVRAVTFDCWGTLISDLEPDRARRLRTEAIMRLTGVDETRALGLFDEAWRAHFDSWVAGVHYGSEGMAAYIVSQTVGETDGIAVQLTQIFEDVSEETGVRLVDGAAETLEAIKSSGRATALVCDTGFTPGRVVRRLLEAHRVAGFLDYMAFSNEVGVPKPNRKMFDTALNAIGGGTAVHIGDLRRTDIAGARGAGMGAVRFRGVWDDTAPEYPEGDVVLDDMRDLPALLE
jgi:putative hydrolase of the HAD superfamily